MELISRVLQVPESEITGIKCLKTGMTNKSFLLRSMINLYLPDSGTGDGASDQPEAGKRLSMTR